MYNNPLLNIDPRVFKKRIGEMPPLPPNMGEGEVPPLAPPVLGSPPVPAREAMGEQPPPVNLLSEATRPRRVEGEGLPMPEMVQMPEGTPVSAIPPPQNLPQGNRTEQAIMSTPPPPKSERRKGFWGRLKDVGESFVLSGGNPLVAGITAFNPDILTRFKDQQFSEPRWQQQRKQALGEAESLDEADRRDLLNEATQAQIANLGADNQRMAAKDAYDLEQKRKDALSKSEKEAFDRMQASLRQRADLTKDGGEFVNSASSLLFGSRGVDKTGKPLPITENQGNIIPSLDNKGFFRQPSTQQVQERKLAQVTNEAKARGAVDIEKRLAMLPIEMREFRDKERIKASFASEQEKINLTGLPTVTQFETAKAEAKELATRASNARASHVKTKNEDDLNEANKLQTQADDAYGRAEAFHSAMIESGAYDDNSAGGWVGLRPKARAKKGGMVGGQKAAPAKGKAQRVITQATYDEMVKDAAAGDQDAIKAVEAIKAGRYTVK